MLLKLITQTNLVSILLLLFYHFDLFKSQNCERRISSADARLPFKKQHSLNDHHHHQFTSPLQRTQTAPVEAFDAADEQQSFDEATKTIDELKQITDEYESEHSMKHVFVDESKKKAKTNSGIRWVVMEQLAPKILAPIISWLVKHACRLLLFSNDSKHSKLPARIAFMRAQFRRGICHRCDVKALIRENSLAGNVGEIKLAKLTLESEHFLSAGIDPRLIGALTESVQHFEQHHCANHSCCSAAYKHDEFSTNPAFLGDNCCQNEAENAKLLQRVDKIFDLKTCNETARVSDTKEKRKSDGLTPSSSLFKIKEGLLLAWTFFMNTMNGKPPKSDDSLKCEKRTKAATKCAHRRRTTSWTIVRRRVSALFRSRVQPLLRLALVVNADDGGASHSHSRRRRQASDRQRVVRQKRTSALHTHIFSDDDYYDDDDGGIEEDDDDNDNNNVDAKMGDKENVLTQNRLDVLQGRETNTWTEINHAVTNERRESDESENLSSLMSFDTLLFDDGETTMAATTTKSSKEKWLQRRTKRRFLIFVAFAVFFCVAIFMFTFASAAMVHVKLMIGFFIALVVISNVGLEIALGKVISVMKNR